MDVGSLGHDALVERPRLLERLERTGAPLVVLNAPAGYGKSTLLAQWASHDTRPFASVALSESHDDPAVLLDSIVEALDRVEPASEAVSRPRPAPGADLNLVLRWLEQMFDLREQPMVLVLDELEHVQSGQSLRLIETVVANVPAGSQLAIATRSTTLPHLGRLRASRRLDELGLEELAMTRRESEELLARTGLRPSAEQLDSLLEKTAGWPAALYLAGLSLLKEPDVDAAISRLGGRERILVDYMDGELLAQQPGENVEFLMRVSILDRLGGDLCDAMLDRTGSANLLRELSRGNMLLTTLDRRDEWFRLHTLLVDMLRSELERTHPDEIPGLHRRASAWWQAHGDPERAVHHAIEAGEVERAAQLVWAAVPELMPKGRYATIRRWLDRLGDERLVAYPHLSQTLVHGHLSTGEGGVAEHWNTVTRGLLQSMPEGERPASVVAGMELARAMLTRGGIRDMREGARIASEALSVESPWLSMCSMAEGIADFLEGRHEDAHENLADAARRAAVWGAPILQVVSLAQLALLASEEDDWLLARILTSQARAQVERSGLAECPTMALVFAASAFVKSHDERSDAAGADLRSAIGLLARLEDFGAWYEAETRVALAGAAVQLNDIALARDLLTQAARYSRSISGAPALEGWLERLVEETERISAATAAELTPAELRVVRFMPTHLSFPEIAAELYVSPNTVKTQAQAAYRKLGASGRSEAVERAGEAGLLGSDQVA